MPDRQSAHFCALGERPLTGQNELAVAFHDHHPVTALHTLVVPRRHAATYFDLHESERRAINLLLDQARGGFSVPTKQSRASTWA